MADTPKGDGFWVNHVTGKNGLFGRLGQDGAGKTLKQNFAWAEGNKKVVFGRLVGTGVGLAMAGEALFNSKTADGEERSGLARVGEFVLGTGVAAGSLLAGKGR